MPMVRPDEILAFWFGDGDEDRSEIWFGGGPEFDAVCKSRFAEALAAADAGDLDHWRNDPRSALAWIILVDQLSRNIFRGTAQAFALDTRAVAWTKHGLAQGYDRQLGVLERGFLYMPLEHSENLDDQRLCVRCFEELAREAPSDLQERARGFVEFAKQHMDLIERFGRFPHRNAVLGRPSTAEERAYLKDGERFDQ